MDTNMENTQQELEEEDETKTTTSKVSSQSPLQTFRQTARVVKMLCAICLAIRRYAMDAGFLESYTVNVSRRAHVTNDDGNPQEVAQFNLKDFQRRKELPVPTALIFLLDKHPSERTQSDVQAIASLMANMASFRSYTREMQYMLCRIVRYMKCHKRRVVLRKGHIGYNLYFIFSGSVSVILDKDDGNVFVKSDKVVLRRGACFGEIALMQNTRRNATVVCHEDCEFLVIDKQDFLLHGLHNQLQEEVSARYDFFRSWKAFSSWSNDEIKALSYVSRTESFGYDKVIVPDSGKNEWLWFVVKGSCDIIHHVNLERFSAAQEPKEEEPTLPHLLVPAQSCDHTRAVLPLRPSTGSGQRGLFEMKHSKSNKRPKTTIGLKKESASETPRSHVKKDRVTFSDGDKENAKFSEDMRKKSSQIIIQDGRSIRVGVFVKLDTLRDGQCFGLDAIFGVKRSTSLVSKGCEVIHIPRKRVTGMADERTLERLEREMKTYPEDSVLYKRFLETDAWAKYKRKVYTECLPEIVKIRNRESIVENSPPEPNTWAVTRAAAAMNLNHFSRSNHHPVLTSIYRTTPTTIGRVSATDVMNGATRSELQKEMPQRMLTRSHSQPNFGLVRASSVLQRGTTAVTPDPHRFMISRYHVIKLKTT